MGIFDKLKSVVDQAIDAGDVAARSDSAADARALAEPLRAMVAGRVEPQAGGELHVVGAFVERGVRIVVDPRRARAAVSMRYAAPLDVIGFELRYDPIGRLVAAPGRAGRRPDDTDPGGLEKDFLSDHVYQEGSLEECAYGRDLLERLGDDALDDLLGLIEADKGSATLGDETLELHAGRTPAAGQALAAIMTQLNVARRVVAAIEAGWGEGA